MTSASKDKPASDQKLKRSQQHDAIGKKLMLALGQPADFYAVQIRHLWEDSFRVNVLTGKDASCVKIVNSYFLTASSDGQIVTSTPKITKQY